MSTPSPRFIPSQTVPASAKVIPETPKRKMQSCHGRTYETGVWDRGIDSLFERLKDELRASREQNNKLQEDL